MNEKQMELLKGRTIKDVHYKDDGYYGIQFEDGEIYLTFESMKNPVIYRGELKINIESDIESRHVGDIFKIKDFIDHCERGSFVDYDGYANELVLNNKIIASFRESTGSSLLPSDIDIYGEYLLELSNKYESLGIIWYNR